MKWRPVSLHPAIRGKALHFLTRGEARDARQHDQIAAILSLGKAGYPPGAPDSSEAGWVILVSGLDHADDAVIGL